MDAVLQSLITGFPILIAHFLTTVAMLAAGILIYVKSTPMDEIGLIRGGNTAAALSMAGAVVGLGLPLASAMAASVNLLDILVWGVVTLVIQLSVFRVIDLILKDLPGRIEKGEMGAATLLVSVKLSVAAINAAAVS